MNIKDLLQDDALKELEDSIIIEFKGPIGNAHDYTDERCLLQVRQNIINQRVLKHEQVMILPDIIAFNDALCGALQTMYDKACAVYKANKDFGEDVTVEACCYLSNEYPKLHPVQCEDRQELWDAIRDSGWNLLYESGVTHPLCLSKGNVPTFKEFTGMDCPPPNWNEGLDQELTKDLHLINAFHNLFDHTDFAITDFIYCRDFYYEIKVEFRDETQQNH